MLTHFSNHYDSKLNKRISQVQKHVDGKEEGKKIVGEEGRMYVMTGIHTSS